MAAKKMQTERVDNRGRFMCANVGSNAIGETQHQQDSTWHCLHKVMPWMPKN
jgi:hypothetical protein